MFDNQVDPIQHGIDNNSSHDTEKGAALGGLGGAVIGGMAGSLVGPAGTAIGAVVGGLVGAVASGVAVKAVDRIDHDNQVSDVGEHTPRQTGMPTGDYDIDGDPANWAAPAKTKDADSVNADPFGDGFNRPRY